jgi:pyruvate/2-oxoglutarate dehydrogenase complex dihydrolipoamide acyltransferase (E2) component
VPLLSFLEIMMSEETTKPSLSGDTVVWLVGAGRDVHTRAERRMNRFGRRAVRIGEYLVRPGRRVDLRLSSFGKLLPLLKARMEEGVVRVMVGDHAYTYDEIATALGSAPPALLATEPPPAPEPEPEPAPEPEPEAPAEEPEPEPEAPAEEPAPAPKKSRSRKKK